MLFMKLSILILLAFILLSCSRSHDEQRLYDFQSNNIKEIYNKSLQDLDYKINSLSKKNIVLARDSATYYKKLLTDLLVEKSYINEVIDSLSPNYITRYAMTGVNLTKKHDLGFKKDTIEAYTNAYTFKNKYDNYIKNPDSILSHQYRGDFSMINPKLNNDSIENFEWYFYTDAESSKFIAMEDVDNLLLIEK